MRIPSKLFLIATVLSATITSHARTDSIFAVHKNNEIFNWKKFETPVPVSFAKDFVQQVHSNFSFYDLDEFHSIDTAYLHLHFLDMTNDGNMAVIYEGWRGGETNTTQIFINTNKGWRKVFEQQQTVYRFIWKNNKLSQIFIENPGCCADYVKFEKGFAITYDAANQPIFKQFYQAASVWMGDMIQPDSFFNKPFRFEVLNDNYKLRSQPYIDDTAYWAWDDDTAIRKATGDVVGILSKGTTGTALAKKTDSTGRVWWYVEIDEQYTLGESVLYKEENNFPTKAKGWLSSRFVRVLNNR